jgi:sec-independent protein translocase protein TatA
MFGNLTGWHAVILLVIILLLFGAPKLPALARSLGQSLKIFKSEVKTPEGDKSEAAASTEPGDTPAKS